MSMYNVGARYAIIGRVTEGTTVISYMVEDSQTGTKYPMDKQIVEQLALNKQIYNCYAQVYNKIVNLKGINCKLNQMPKYDRDGKRVVEDVKVKRQAKADFEIVGKIPNGRTVVAYVLKPLNNPNAQLVKLSRAEVIELAHAGRISNAKCQFSGGTILLRGIHGKSLNDIKVYNE